ncbi:TPA: hypothetical protein ACG8PG_002775, partial [Enterococcus faecium]|nr:hypothetical protein [Enterococcus faecium]
MKYNNLKPKLLNENIEYIREENYGYLTIVPKNGTELKDNVFNPTVRYILANCTGKNSVKKIANGLKKKFPSLEYEKFYQDVVGTIKFFKHYNIIDIGDYSMEEKKIYKIEQNLELELLNESHYEEIYNFITDHPESMYFHEDIYHQGNSKELEVVLRYNLFSFTSEFYFLRHKERIVGMVSIIVNPFQNLSYSIVNYLICEPAYTTTILTTVLENINEVSILEVKKLVIHLLNSTEDESLIPYLKDSHFFK